MAWIRIFGPNNSRFPGIGFGDPVPYFPEKLEQLYEEARASGSANAYTAAVLVCRALIVFVEMLLRFIYEFPRLVPPSA